MRRGREGFHPRRTLSAVRFRCFPHVPSGTGLWRAAAPRAAWADNGKTALELFDSGTFDLAILEVMLLRYFISHAGQIVTRDELLENV